MTDKLKPCPFCGNLPELTDTSENGKPNYRGIHWHKMVCNSRECPAFHPIEIRSDSKQKTIEAWNKRAAF